MVEYRPMDCHRDSGVRLVDYIEPKLDERPQVFFENKIEQDAFEFVRTMAHLHTELLALQRGELVNLHVSGQQYAYARKAPSGVVVIAINNDSKPAKIEFDVTPAGLANGDRLIDRLAGKEVRVESGKVTVLLLPRSAALFVRR